MKRLVSAISVVVLLVVAGGLASACQATPPAASVNGTTIQISTLNDQLRAFETTQAGACLLTIEAAGSAVQVRGQGAQGTYNMTFAGSVLHQGVSNILYEQYAADQHITVTPAQTAAAKSEVESFLDGSISTQLSQADPAGQQSYCQTNTGQAVTGAEVLAGLPPSLRDAQIQSQAIEDRLLARGANVTAADIFAYYVKNPTQFTGACVERHRDGLAGPCQRVAGPGQRRRLDRVGGQGQLPGSDLGAQRRCARMQLHRRLGRAAAAGLIAHRGRAGRADPRGLIGGLGDLRGHR